MAQDLARTRAADLIPGHVLAHVPGFTGSTSAWAARLHGGTVNSSFRVETSAGEFVVRLHDPAARHLGADHEREARLHSAAAAAGIAPALVYVDDAFEFMIMEYIPGPVWTAEDFARPDRLAQLGAVLRKLHQVQPPDVAPFDVPSVLQRYHDRLAEALPAERARFAHLLERGEAALAACATLQRPKTLVHNDLYHSNLIGTERLYLIDWEYGAVADPLFDLASALAYYPQAGAHAHVLLEASGLSAVASAEMLAQATWLWVLISYLWYRTRRLDVPLASAASLAAERALLERLERSA